jgi:hypothetical protein
LPENSDDENTSLTPMHDRHKMRPPDLLCTRWKAVLLAAALFLPMLLTAQDAFARSGRFWAPGPAQVRIQQRREQRQQNRARRREHLNQWLQQHQDLPLAEQEKALSEEPGFNRLPPAMQDRMRERLRQLNAMPPQERQRYLNRIEAMERLTPQQRQDVRGAILRFGSLPPDRRRLVGKAFRDMREMPPQQRRALLNSRRFHGQFSDHERDVLNHLLAVEPYLPPPHPPRQQQQNQEPGK